MARKELPSIKKASDLFTDREEPRFAFWQKMKELEENPGYSGRIAYYGEGGIGKSWLLNQLKREVDSLTEYQKKEKDFSEISHLNYPFRGSYLPVYYDLESSTDIVEILCSIRASIFQSYPNFRFPVFDTAIRKYEDLTGKIVLPDLKDSENKNLSLFEKVFDMASAFPGIGSVNAVYKNLKESYEIAADVLSRIKDIQVREQLRHVSSMETVEDLRKAIPDYFVADLSDDNRDFSLVLLIDTFEIFYHSTDQKYNDEYVLKEYLPVNCENVLFVYAGRYRIFEDEHISQHLIGDLSREDSCLYLKEKQGIKDEKVVEKIYEITGGTPIFLDICVSNYRNENYPSAEEFKVLDKKELVRRYMQYQGENEQLLIRLMSSMMHWKDKDFKELFEKVYETSFALYAESYQRVVESTMIEKISEERRFLHRSVRAAIYDDPAYPKENKEKTLQLLIEMYQKKARDQDDDPLYYEERIIELLQMVSDQKEKLDDTQMRALLETVKDSSGVTVSYGVVHIRNYLNALEEFVSGLSGKEKDAYSFLLCNLYDVCGEYDKAFVIRKEKAERYRKAYGEEHPSTIHALAALAGSYFRMKQIDEELALNEALYQKTKENKKLNEELKAAIITQLANSYYEKGRYNEALKMHEENLANKKKIYGENDSKVLLEMNNLALDYNKMDRKEDAIRLQEEVCARRKEILGEDHPDTLRAYAILQAFYKEQGRKEEALKLNEMLYEKQKEILGIEHPDTMFTMSHLADSYIKENRYEDALRIHTDLLEARQQKYASDSVEVISALRYVAFDHFKLKMYEKSASEYDEVLKTVSSSQNTEDINRFKKDLAAVYNTMGKSEEAIRLYEEVWSYLKENEGADSERSLAAATGLYHAYRKKEDYRNAYLTGKEILSAKKKSLSADDPELDKWYRNLAFDLYKIGNYELSLENYQTVLDRSRNYNRDALKIALAYFDAASVLNTMKHSDEALAYYKECYRIRKELLGEENESTRKVAKRIAALKK